MRRLAALGLSLLGLGFALLLGRSQSWVVFDDFARVLGMTLSGSVGQAILNFITPILYTSFGFVLSMFYEQVKRRHDQEVTIRAETRRRIPDLVQPLLDLIYTTCKGLLLLTTCDPGGWYQARPNACKDAAAEIECSLSRLKDFVRDNRSVILLYLPSHFLWVFAKLEADVQSNILAPICGGTSISRNHLKNSLLLLMDLEDDLRTISGLKTGRKLRSVSRLKISL